MNVKSQKSIALVALTLSSMGAGASLGCGTTPLGDAGASGGVVGSGGALSGSGGALPGSGGASGGAPNGSGGATTASGGSVGAGGASSASGGAGSGGESTGSGGAGSGGEPGNSGAPDPSPGCGMTEPTDCLPCQTSGRDYYVDLPSDYDPNTPYPVVFKYHPLGGSATQARNMYLGVNDFEAIYVSQDGSDNGFPNTGGVDEQMTREIMEDIEARLCVDRARYYATGFSYGGSMSFTAACNMSDKFRAIASMAGAPISGAACVQAPPERPVAILAIHGEEDTALPITMGEPMVEAMLEKNGCTTVAEPSPLLDPECVRDESALDAGSYQGCMEGYPVIWCPIPDYPHNMPTWSRGAIAAFFEMF